MVSLVLGGTRYMGVHLVNELVSLGHDVTIATRGITTDPFGHRVRRVIADRYNADSLRNAFAAKSYDLVFDNLAYASNDVRLLMDAVHAKKVVMTSSVSVYHDFHMDIKETEADTTAHPLKWCDRDDFTYDETKRQAEAALFQKYTIPSVAVRFPWIFGEDDYTKRLFFYVDHVLREQAMHVDNLEARLSFIHSREAGHFLARIAEMPVLGSVNACSNGTISIQEIIRYTEERSGKKAILHEHGDSAPLNGVPSFCLNTSMAVKAGCAFSHVREWVYPLIALWVQGVD